MAAANATRAMREKITFDANVPVTVSFEFPSQAGQPQASKSGGEEFRYFLHGNKIMWIPPAAEAALRKHGEPDTVTITKQKIGTSITWLVEAPEEEPAIAAQLEASIAYTKNTTEARARTELAPAQPSQFAGSPARKEHPTPAEVREANEHARRITPATARLVAALCSAIDATIEAEAYAESRGVKLRFSEGSIRALANCSEIGEQR
jgi:hypothetical protein